MEHGGTGIVAAMDKPVSYRSSRVINRQHARNCALPTEKEVNFGEINEVDSMSTAATDSEKK